MKIFPEYLTNFRFRTLTCICLALYSSMIVLQAFNADDIIQGQPISGDANTFLAQGRWGYYFIYMVLQNGNPLGPASLIAGIYLLTVSSAVAASILKFERGLANDFFIVVSTVSLYYSAVLSFDSTRIAYPVATLLAILGVKLVRQKYYTYSIFCFALAPAIYPASTQISLTLIFSLALLCSLRGCEAKSLIREVATSAVCMALGLAIYILSTHLSVIVTNVPLSGRSMIDPIAAMYEYERLIRLFLGHSIPNGYQMYYFTPAMKVLLWIMMVLFIINIIRNINGSNFLVVIFSLVGISISPFALAFASPIDEFTPRALIAFTIAHGLFAAVALDGFGIKNQQKRLVFTSVVATSYVILTSVQINASAFDAYLSSRNDILATNRMISRIDEVVSASNIPLSGPIPLFVRYREPINMSPAGEPSTARSAPWSKEWIFRQIDPRFTPVSVEVGNRILKNAPAVMWPDPSSIYIDGDVVVVIIN